MYFCSSSLSSPLSQMENLAFRERAWVMAVSMDTSWLIKSYRDYIQILSKKDIQEFHNR